MKGKGAKHFRTHDPSDDYYGMPPLVATRQLQEMLNVPPGGVAFLPGRLLFSKLWGSHSHNTALPTSDRDYMMIYVKGGGAL